MSYNFSIKAILIFALLTLINLEYNAQLSPDQFQEDLEQLEELILNKHAKPFWKSEKSDFNSALLAARKKFSEVENCDQSCYVEFMKVIATLKDGHSVMAGNSRYEKFGYLPISIKWFDGELRIVNASKLYRQTLGYRIDTIDGVDIESVLNKLKTVLPHANDSRFKKFMGAYMHLPGLLFSLGISENASQATFTLSNGPGKDFKIKIQNLSPEDEENTEFVSWKRQLENPALYQKDNDLYYWYEYDKKKKLLYFQYNRIGNMQNESSSAFADKLFETVDSVEIKKFVLDLRYNGGGNFPYSIRYIQEILDRLDIDRRGRLFIITGYDTFSAAIDMLNQLEMRSQAIIVGETPGDHPGSPGDPESYVLKNTGIKIYLSSLYHPTLLESDNREYIELDENCITSWDDYQKSCDPCMNYIRKFKSDNLMRVKTTEYSLAIGTYNYTPTRDLKLLDKEGEIWVEITKGFISPLYQTSNTAYFKTEVQGLNLSIEDQKVNLIFPDGHVKTYLKKEIESNAPLELFYLGKIEEAKEAYLSSKKSNPDFKEYEDHLMSFQATLAFFELRKYPNVNASEIAKSMLNLGIEMNNGNAPFCEFSLRFY